MATAIIREYGSENMAAKTRVTRLESEIEKCRVDANWPKALDLARQISSKSATLGIASLI